MQWPYNHSPNLKITCLSMFYNMFSMYCNFGGTRGEFFGIRLCNCNVDLGSRTFLSLVKLVFRFQG